MSEFVTLAALAAEEEACTRCPLYRDATQSVPGEGPRGAPVMFVGEQPGDVEDLAGRPFIGPAGRLLDKALRKVGLPREECFVTNAVKHFKFEPRGKRRLHKKPDAGEIDACRWWLEHERTLVDPGLIVALAHPPSAAFWAAPNRLRTCAGGSSPSMRGRNSWRRSIPLFCCACARKPISGSSGRAFSAISKSPHNGRARKADGGRMGRNFLCLCAGLMAASPCRAEFLRFDGAGGQTRALLKINGKSHDLPVAWMRPEKPAPGASLFVETVANGDLAPAALRRGMTVAVIDLAKLPGDSRAQALRDLAPALRLAASAGRILARGDRETGADLAEAGAFFDGLLLKDSSAGAAGTRVIETFGSDAYWRAAPRTGAKAGDADNRRRFFLAGTAEAGATGNCAAQVNARSPAPALRALLVALEEWTKGVKPPPSRVPAAGELVAARELNWPKIPGLAAPAPDDRLVPRIDPDGNETSGLRLPDHALPIATFTGFNTRKDRNGAPCAAGAAAPFPPSRGDRERNGDPRLSLLERYGSRAYFVATMRVVADRLVKDRLLLKEDADAYVATAKTAPF